MCGRERYPASWSCTKASHLLQRHRTTAKSVPREIPVTTLNKRHNVDSDYESTTSEHKRRMSDDSGSITLTSRRRLLNRKPSARTPPSTGTPANGDPVPTSNDVGQVGGVVWKDAGLGPHETRRSGECLSRAWSQSSGWGQRQGPIEREAPGQALPG